MVLVLGKKIAKVLFIVLSFYLLSCEYKKKEKVESLPINNDMCFIDRHKSDLFNTFKNYRCDPLKQDSFSSYKVFNLKEFVSKCNAKSFSYKEYNWPSFVNDICTNEMNMAKSLLNKRYDNLNKKLDYYVKCQNMLEKSLKCLKEVYEEKMFILVERLKIEKYPTLSEIQELEKYLFLDAETSRILPITKREQYCIKDYNTDAKFVDKPYHLACGGYLREIEKILNSENSIKLFTKKHNEDYPLDCAKKFCHLDVVSLLRNHGAPENLKINTKHCDAIE